MLAAQQTSSHCTLPQERWVRSSSLSLLTQSSADASESQAQNSGSSDRQITQYNSKENIHFREQDLQTSTPPSLALLQNPVFCLSNAFQFPYEPHLGNFLN